MLTHILVVPSGYPENLIPYRGIFYKRQAESLNKSEQLRITVAYPEIWSIKTFGKQRDQSGISYREEDRIPTYRWKGFNYFANLPYTTESIFYNRLKKIYHKLVEEQGRPDIIHAHSCLWAGYAAAKLSKEEKIPLVITEHSSVFGRGLLKPYQKRLVEDALNQTSEVIAVGPRLQRELSEYTNKTIHVIPNAVDHSFFQVDIHPPEEPFRFLTIANLNRNKGIDLLIYAFEERFKGTNVELYIGGDGPNRQELEDLTVSKELSEQVHFLGALDKEQVKYEIGKSHVFVLPSRYETFGVVLVEALAAGKPIISTKCGGPEMIVSDINGKLVPVDDHQALSKAMVLLKDTYSDYRVDAIIADCKQRFSEESVNNQIEEIYNKVTKYDAKKIVM
ncbi:glycosyltransferase [Bacillus sp. Cs-700]|uniref:glycosyltransferase n=1 Tax=Bacillus sp. Cs-700 TaxID=2589818 RepID=UPI001408BFF0|nr:glycosyltransferase [Bacillus sp. Cs-700]